MANKTLLIAVDNSQACLKAIDFVLENFPNGYTYHLLHVQARPYVTFLDAGADTFAYEAALDRSLTDESKTFIKDYFIPKATSAGAHVVAHVLHSDSDGSNNIGSAICKYAEDINPAAMVLMRENKSSMSRFFLGSVSRYCAVHSPVPIVVVPSAPPPPPPAESPATPATATPPTATPPTPAAAQTAPEQPAA